MDLPMANANEPAAVMTDAAAPSAAADATAEAPISSTSGDGTTTNKKRSADDADLKGADGKDLTEAQKLERRERNREHAKRSRLRKKFLLESLQDQIAGLEEQLEGLKNAIKTEIPDKAEQIITTVCGSKEKYTPLPMPSGFGPVKTLMEPDFRLMSALSGSQQNFAISDPSLPDNPIVYVSQGFLDLTGYTLDQVLGRNCRFLQGPGTDQSAVEVIRKGIKEGVDTSVCLLNYKADGTPFWNQFFVAALRDAENNVVNYVGVQCEVSKAVVEKHMADQRAT
jgi:PAS domain S-box-containing protein